jgi:hypothetical protein
VYYDKHGARDVYYVAIKTIYHHIILELNPAKQTGLKRQPSNECLNCISFQNSRYTSCGWFINRIVIGNAYHAILLGLKIFMECRSNKAICLFYTWGLREGVTSIYGEKEGIEYISLATPFKLSSDV